MRSVSLKGVLIGGITDVVTSVILGIPFAIYAMSRLDLAQIPKEKVGSAVTAAMSGNIPLYLGQLIVGMGCSVLGGYVSAWLAKHDELLNGALSAFLCVSIGLYSIALGKDSHSLLVQILLLIASPALGLLGGYLRLKHQRASGPRDFGVVP
jgi:hypothetical protein